METLLTGAIFTLLTGGGAGLFVMAQKHPKRCQSLCATIEPAMWSAALVSLGLVAGAVSAKWAIGTLAAGMFAGDFAITDGLMDEDAAADGGRWIIARIANGTKPLIHFYSMGLVVFALAWAICSGAQAFAKRVEAEQAPSKESP